MKIPVAIGLLLAGFGAGFFTGRGTYDFKTTASGSGGRKTEVSNHGNAVIMADSKSPARAGASEAERRVRGGVRAFAPGQAGPWVAAMIARLMEKPKSATFYDEMLHEFSFFDAEMMREAAAAWTAERNKAPVAGEETDWHKVDNMESPFYQQWARTDAAGATAYLCGLPSENKRGHLFWIVFAISSKNDVAAARARIEGLTGQQKEAATGGFIIGLAENDPAQALREAVSSNLASAAYGAEVAAMRLVKTDPPLAMELAGRAAETPLGPRILKETAEVWAKNDPAAAEAWVRNYSGTGRSETLASLFRNKLDTDFDRIVEEFPSLTTGLEEHKEVKELAAEIVGKQIKQSSPQAAAAWTARLPEGPVRAAAQEKIIGEWVKTDVMQASEWIRQLPAGAGKNSSVQKLIQAVLKSDPASAFEWANVISQPEMKQKALDSIFETWRELNPEAAAAAQAGLGK